MVDFDDLKKDAEKFVDEHETQVDEGIDKAAHLAGEKFGHEKQLDEAAEKLKGFTGEHDKA